MTELAAPLLSICIPSYNRAAFLPALLDSIERGIRALPLPWTPDRIEVVLCDNASQDDTPAIAARYAERLRLRYHRHAENVGPDRNYLAIVEHASGRFCWLMGSDDAVEPAGLVRVLEGCRDWHDAAGISVNVAGYDTELRHRVAIPEPVSLREDRLLTGPETIFATLAGHWGYLSSHVVRRDLWNDVCATGDHLDFINAYVHVYIMGRMVQAVPEFGYINQKCVGWRSGNDSFLAGSNWLRRMKLDIVGYHQIATALFGENAATTRHIRDTVARTHILSQFRSAKARGRAATGEASWLIARSYWRSPVFWSRLLPWIMVPGPLVRTLFAIHLRRRAR